METVSVLLILFSVLVISISAGIKMLLGLKAIDPVPGELTGVKKFLGMCNVALATAVAFCIVYFGLAPLLNS